MKTLRRIFAVCLVLGSLVVMAGFATMDENNAAGLTKDRICGAYGGGYSLMTDQSIAIDNHGGNVTLICNFHGIENPPAEKLEFWGFACGIATTVGDLWTNNSYLTIDPMGDAMMRCQVKKPKL